MKKDMLMPIAERMYVIEQQTIDSTAASLQVAEKTIRLWKAEGNWDVKRSQYLKTKTDFHEDLYNFARKLMKVIALDLDRMIETPTIDDAERDKRIESRINSMSRLLDKLPKTKDYEARVKAEEQAEAEVPGDMIAAKVKEILGA